MARSPLTTVLADFEAVVERMRAKGVHAWTGSPVGDLVLGPEPLSKKALKSDKDPKAQRRVYYAEVLGRPVTDAELEKLP